MAELPVQDEKQGAGAGALLQKLPLGVAPDSLRMPFFNLLPPPTSDFPVPDSATTLPLTKRRISRPLDESQALEPGSPWKNGSIESFIGKLRYELLNGEVPDTLDEAKVLMDAWRKIYNRIRPHSTLGDLTPQQLVDKYKSSSRSQKTPFSAGSVLG